MALYLVTYDLNRPGQNYPDLFDRIKGCGNAWHGMQNVWFIVSELKPLDIVNRVKTAVDAGDKIFVSRVEEAAWSGFTEEATNWIRQHAK